jgi:spore germination protein GerM
MKNVFYLVLLVAILFFGYKYLLQNPKPISNQPIQSNIENKPLQDFQLFFNNTIKNPNLIDCSLMFSVKRQTNQKVTYEFLVNTLINGLTQKEEKDGYVTAIPKNLELNFVKSEEGKVIVDFKPFQIAGSCATGMFTAQVKKTLLAIDQTKEIVITIQGKSEDILQP